jgi:hypothetical protein
MAVFELETIGDGALDPGGVKPDRSRAATRTNAIDRSDSADMLSLRIQVELARPAITMAKRCVRIE